MINAIIIFWAVLNLLLAFFVIHELGLLFYSLTRLRKRKTKEFDVQNAPEVLLQLPIYNERFVVRDLIDSILKLDYPADKLTIQILDDSTDDTVSIVQEHLEKIKNQGFRIEHIRREKREGYKAGALDYGLSLNQSPFVAIFDADFRPSSDFLKKPFHFLKTKL